ncbi:MAG TPA: hypothetical protein VIG30_02240 [Ktedonobacterales bacterium]
MQLHLPTTLQQFAALDAHLLVVSFAPPPRLERFTRYLGERVIPRGYTERGLPPPDQATLYARTRFAADPALAAYHAYGLGRNTWLRVYGPRIILQYVAWGLRGRRIGLGGDEDTLQRGGNFVVGRDGRLMLAHTGRDQADRPSVAAILEALRRGGTA